MLAHCSNPECSLQFAADMATCPCCGHASVDLARQGNLVATITNSPIISVGIVTTYFGFRFLFAGREAAPTATRMDDIYID
jgi:hypothetical protein